MKKALTPKAVTWLLTLVYFSGYLTRTNFQNILVAVETDTGHTNELLGIVVSCLFFSYAIGQIVNGRLSDKIKPQTMIMCGLTASSIINLIFPFCAGSIPVMCVLWGINGFVQAMLWPPMIQIMVRAMDADAYTENVPLLTIGSSAAKVLIVVLAPVMLLAFNWRAIFFFCAAFALIVATVFIINRNRFDLRPLPQADGKKKGLRLPKAAIFPIVLIFAAIVLHGALRDSLDTWMPNYLKAEFAFDDKLAILCKVFLTTFGVLSIFISKWVFRKFFKNEVACAVWLFAIASTSALILFALFGLKNVPITIVTMTLVYGIQSGINLMLISYVPKRFSAYGNISTITGLLDAFAYAGSAISMFGITSVVKGGGGWRAATLTWLLVSAAGTFCVLVAMRPWKRFCREADALVASAEKETKAKTEAETKVEA